MKLGTWNLRLTLTIFLLSSFLMGCGPAASSLEPATLTHTYVASTASILNPERGFFTPYELPGTAGFSPVRATGNTLVHLNIRLDDWRETDIPQDILDGLQTNFNDIRDAGVKAIIRFSYNAGPYPDSEPDASKEQILRHIKQLTPLLQTNADVIAWLEAGFIGAWGEWHTSTNELDNLTDKHDILNALLAAIPDRYVQVRYPANIIEMYPNPEDATKAYVAHHNDCFLSSDTDVGTYERDGVNTIERDQKYLAELTRFTPMSGETCAPNPPRSDCPTAIQEMELLHFSAINEAYHKGILRSWEEGGCMDEINNRLGYRLALTSTDFNEQVRTGGLLNLSVNITNLGFAALMNLRPLYVILVGRDDFPPYEVKLELDPRTWQPGDSSFTASIRLPSKIEEGEYTLALWLPDAAETLQGSPMYSVRFANDDIWDESTGYNILGKVTVDDSVAGNYESTNLMQVEKLLIKTATTIATSGPSPIITPTIIQTSTLQITPMFPPLGNSSLPILNPIVKYNNGNLTIQFEYLGEIKDYNAFQVFIDMDYPVAGGYLIQGMDADLLLENNTLNRYAGQNQEWAWDQIGPDLMYINESNVVSWMITDWNEQALPPMRLVFQIVDTNWNASFTTEPISLLQLMQ